MQGGERLTVSIVSCSFDPADRDADALLDRYPLLTGWADAIAGAGADAVAVVQRFRRDALVRRRGVEYHFVADGAAPSPPSWFGGARMADVVRRLRPAVVHVDGLVFPMVVRCLRRKLPRQTAIVVQDHGGIHAQSASLRSWRWRALHRLGLSGADGFLFTARDQAIPWQRAGIIRSTQTLYEVLEGSADLASWPRSPAADPGLPGRPALLWVGRLDPNKDPLTVLDGFELAIAEVPDAALTLVYPEDRLLAEVKARIARSPALRSRVHLLGRLDRSELPLLYAAADLFVLASHHEGSSFSLIEALSLGATPIVTDIPSFRAITDGGRLGALFAPGDARALAAAIGRLGRSELVGRRRSVRAHFERDLTWSAVSRRAMASYRDASTTRRRSFA
jgi:glycosyltransferase involved in cell wall biosynthesis